MNKMKMTAVMMMMLLIKTKKDSSSENVRPRARKNIMRINLKL
jgi:hypothetical protein